MVFIVCEKCGGHYKLQKGETLDDFESCHCGGKLKYSDQFDDDSHLRETIICPWCSKETPNVNFCEKCGVSLHSYDGIELLPGELIYGVIKLIDGNKLTISNKRLIHRLKNSGDLNAAYWNEISDILLVNSDALSKKVLLLIQIDGESIRFDMNFEECSNLADIFSEKLSKLQVFRTHLFDRYGDINPLNEDILKIIITSQFIEINRKRDSKRITWDNISNISLINGRRQASLLIEFVKGNKDAINFSSGWYHKLRELFSEPELSKLKVKFETSLGFFDFTDYSEKKIQVEFTTTEIITSTMKKEDIESVRWLDWNDISKIFLTKAQLTNYFGFYDKNRIKEREIPNIYKIDDMNYSKLESIFSKTQLKNLKITYGKSYGTFKPLQRPGKIEITSQAIIYVYDSNIFPIPWAVLKIITLNLNESKLLSQEKRFRSLKFNRHDIIKIERIFSEPEFKDLNIKIIGNTPKKRTPKVDVSDAVSELKIAKELFENGAITEEEYQKLKNKYLDII